MMQTSQLLNCGSTAEFIGLQREDTEENIKEIILFSYYFMFALKTVYNDSQGFLQVTLVFSKPFTFIPLSVSLLNIAIRKRIMYINKGKRL